jgi:cytochrome c biogenesis protein CcdA
MQGTHRGLLRSIRACWLLLALALLAAPPTAGAEEQPLPPDIEFFTNRKCTHCEDAAAFLGRLVEERPEIVLRTVYPLEDEAARDRFRALVARADVKAATTPAFFVRGRFLVGWTSEDTTGRIIEKILDDVDITDGELGGTGCLVDLSKDVGEAQPDCESTVPETVHLPFFGDVNPRKLGLPLFTAILGLVDGFNPCAMWILIFLLTFLVHLGSRKRMFLISGTFVLVSGIVYFAFMAAWFTVFDIIGTARGIQITLGVFAVIAGSIHTKDFFAFHKGLTLSIPESAKPGIYARVNRILKAENLRGALAMVVGLAFMVNLVELLCTAGLPAIYTSVLASHDLPRWQYYGYIGAYQLFYMFDDMLMLTIAIITLSRKRLQEGAGRVLKLISGVVMIALGLALIFRPELLSW